MTEPQAPPKEKAAKKNTQYVVLRALPEEAAQPPRFERMGRFKGPASNAIKEAAGNMAASPDGTYVAIPARSFKPVKLATKTETRVTPS
jgi:hypothetical protein